MRVAEVQPLFILWWKNAFAIRGKLKARVRVRVRVRIRVGLGLVLWLCYGGAFAIGVAGDREHQAVPYSLCHSDA